MLMFRFRLWHCLKKYQCKPNFYMHVMSLLNFQVSLYFVCAIAWSNSFLHFCESTVGVSWFQTLNQKKETEILNNWEKKKINPWQLCIFQKGKQNTTSIKKRKEIIVETFSEYEPFEHFVLFPACMFMLKDIISSWLFLKD